jgi:hypothetical protein
MEKRLVIKFGGVLAPDHRISVRTLTRTLYPIQRAVDCIVYYEEFGAVRKFSTLPKNLYGDADFYLGIPEANCVIVPLLKQTGRQITSKIRTYLEIPYASAAEDVHPRPPLNTEVLYALNKVVHGNVQETTHQDLIERREEREREYIEAKVVEQINQALSPVRSSKVGPDDYIAIETLDDAGTTTFHFNQARAKRFNSIATQAHLGPVVVYEGTLHGLTENNSQVFPFVGEFRSNANDNKQSQSLLIPHENLALELSPANLTKRNIKFWAAPVARYGAFDEIRGDIVLIKII